jgi:hypothetical protein
MTTKTPIRISELDQLVAAVPVLLGFHPENSLVLIFTKSNRIVLTTRDDLPVQGLAEPHARMLATSLPAELTTDRVALVVIGPSARHDVTDAVRRRLGERGIEVDVAIWTYGTHAGDGWMCSDGCHHGAVPDPRTTTLGVAAAVEEGRTVRSSRDALAQTMAPTADDATLSRRRAMIEDKASTRNPRGGSAVELCAALYDVETGRLQLDDEDVATLARALQKETVQDTVLVWALRPWLRHAHELWLMLTRETPAPYRATPAALLALTSLMQGDGAMANVALDLAEAAAPGHKLAELVRGAAQTGMSPAQLRLALGKALKAQA